MRINQLVEKLLELKREGKESFLEEKELYDQVKEVYRGLNKLSDFEAENIDKTIQYLSGLAPEIKEKEVEEIGVQEVKTESRAFNKEDLKELMAEYERATEKREKEAISMAIYRLTGEKNMENFIRVQREILAKNKDELTGVRERIKEEIAAEITKIGGVESGRENLEKLGQKEEINKLKEVIEEAVFAKDFEEEKSRKEINKINNKKEGTEKIVEKIAQIRAEIEIEQKAEEIAAKSFEKIKEEIPVKEEVKEKLREEIIRAWREGEELEVPIELGKEKGVEVILEETRIAAEKFKEEKLQSVVRWRAERVEREVARDLRGQGIGDESLIYEYTRTINELNNNSRVIVVESKREEIENYVKNNLDRSPVLSIEESIERAKFTAKNIVMAPKKFNELAGNYSRLKEKLNLKKLPVIKEVRVTDFMSSLLQRNPQLWKLFNQSQRFLGVAEGINSPGNLALRFLGSETGVKIISQIGGQAVEQFVKQAAVQFAQKGSVEGLKFILSQVAGKAGVGAAGVATGGALAGMSTTGVGAIVAAAIVGAKIIKKVVGKIGDGIGKALGFQPGEIKRFFEDSLGLGGLGGKVGQVVISGVGMLIGIPSMIAGLAIGPLLAVIMISFFVFFAGCQMFQHSQISTLVPPPDMDSCILKEEAVSSGSINCNQNAPAVNIAVSKERFVQVANLWRSGKNYAAECFNDVVNRAMCAGIEPTYALAAWLHESGASNYSIDKVEDFGIHNSKTPPKNFDAQITAFLKLNPGGTCLGKPGIGNDYWLSFSANYLNGNCDPNMINPAAGESVNTPAEYKADFLKTFAMMNVPVPKGIKGPVGGNCSGTGAVSGNENTVEIKDNEGKTWICSKENPVPPGGPGGEVPDFRPWDTSIPVPEGCPSGRPTAGGFTQGPFASGCTHSQMVSPAVDIGAGLDTPIYATHAGVAVLGFDGIYGFYIDIHGKCEGKDFYTRYGHMPSGGYRITTNTTVKEGQLIGVVDSTGVSTGNHLHYTIAGLDKNKFGQYLGLSVSQTQQLWGCCGSWNGKMCP